MVFTRVGGYIQNEETGQTADDLRAPHREDGAQRGAVLASAPNSGRDSDVWGAGHAAPRKSSRRPYDP